MKRSTHPTARWTVAIVAGATALVCGMAVSRERGESRSTGMVGLVVAIDEVRVPARDIGQLIEFSREVADQGKVVKKGDVLARIDDSDLKIKKEIANAQVQIADGNAKSEDELKAAEKTQQLAWTEYQKSLKLNEKGSNIVPIQEVERQKLTYQKAGYEANVAKLKISNAKQTLVEKKGELGYVGNQIERRQVIAPISGVITERHHHEGEWVQAGEPIVTIVRMDRVRVQVGLKSTAYAPADVYGRPITITARTPGASDYVIKGKVEFVDSVITVSDDFKVWLEVDNKEVGGFWILRPGQYVDVAIDFDTAAATPEKLPVVNRKSR